MKLYDALKKYAASSEYPFHMPGHKRRMGEPQESCAIDITEIEGFDNLHHAEGILKEAQERAAELYGSKDTYYLVNGSTAGILAAISACVRPQGRILMARNSHKAAYHAAELRGLHISYLYPGKFDSGFSPEKSYSEKSYQESEEDMNYPGEKIGLGEESSLGKENGLDRKCSLNGEIGLSREISPDGGINPEDVRAALEADGAIEAVFITSPTYEGVVSNILEIAKITHDFGIPLIVDEAHGAHFGFHPCFPESSVKLGADIVIHSLHKTLPSMTQTALLHRNGKLVQNERIQKFLDIYQTSSPSYVLMASMDACIELLRENKDRLFLDFFGRLKAFYQKAGRLRRIHFMECGLRYITEGEAKQVTKYFDESGWNVSRDCSKLVFHANGRSGKWLVDVLRERFHLEMEMAAGGYVVALTSIADTEEGFERLYTALQILDGELETQHSKDTHAVCNVINHVQYVINRKEPPLTIAQAAELPHKRVTWMESEGEICAEYIYMYPPGIPLIVPGERISGALLNWVLACRRDGFTLHGMSDYSMQTVEIV